MAIDFPNTPTNGQLYTVGTTTWKYDGTKWNIVAGDSDDPYTVSMLLGGL